MPTLSTPDPRSARLDRVHAGLDAAGLDALLLGPSSDFQWLLGYNPPGLERLTMLVLGPGGQAQLVVPVLEASLAEEHVGGLGIKVLAWQETQDPVGLVRSAVGGATRGLAVGDH